MDKININKQINVLNKKVNNIELLLNTINIKSNDDIKSKIYNLEIVCDNLLEYFVNQSNDQFIIKSTENENINITENNLKKPFDNIVNNSDFIIENISELQINSLPENIQEKLNILEIQNDINLIQETQNTEINK